MTETERRLAAAIDALTEAVRDLIVALYEEEPDEAVDVTPKPGKLVDMTQWHSPDDDEAS